MRVKVKSFKDRLRAYGGDIDKFCEHVRKTMECLKSAGGFDDQALDNFFEALVESHVQAFIKTICVWKTICEQSSTPLNIQSLLNKARHECQQLLVRKKWPRFSGSSKRVEDDKNTSGKRKPDPDIASLLDASKKRSAKRLNKQIKAMLTSNTKINVSRKSKSWTDKEGIFRPCVITAMDSRIA